MNLQYDLSHDELLNEHPEVKDYFLDTGFLDQRDDLEGAQALISNLDFVISTASTPGMMASASGVPTVIYHKPNIWSFGRIGKFVKNPIYENTLSYHTITIKNNDELVNDISDFVVNFLKNKRLKMSVHNIGIIDYGMGNTHSVANAFKEISLAPKLTNHAENIKSFDKIIFGCKAHFKKPWKI